VTTLYLGVPADLPRHHEELTVRLLVGVRLQAEGALGNHVQGEALEHGLHVHHRAGLHPLLQVANHVVHRAAHQVQHP
jgi:hypothetical protein